MFYRKEHFSALTERRDVIGKTFRHSKVFTEVSLLLLFTFRLSPR